MRRKIILSIAVGLGLVGMMASCGGNKSRLEGVNPSEVTADTAQPTAAVEAPVSDSNATAPLAETLTPDTEAATEHSAAPCKTCKGKGTIKCKSCRGKGYTEEFDYRYTKYGCKKCGGGGFWDLDMENHYRKGKGKVKCPTCKGEKA